MGKVSIKRTVSFFIVGIILGISTMVALAGTAYGPWGYYGPVYGYSYRNQNIISVDDDTGIARAKIGVDVDGPDRVPAGYMGGLARMYKDDELFKSTTWEYNSSECWYICVITGPHKETGVSYYAKGSSRAYNGNGYYTYASFQSPCQSY